MRRNVLLVPNDVVGTSMAGPGIRYFHLARELAGHHRITLLVPPGGGALELPGVRVVQQRPDRARQLAEVAPAFDAVVAQDGLDARTMVRLARSRTLTVYDLYVPPSEPLSFHARQASLPLARRRYGAYLARRRLVLTTGRAFLCATGRQRDLLLGELVALGRVGVEQYRVDPSLERLVAVVPFGLPPGEPRHERRVLKGVLPGITRKDEVLLWAGNIWDWLDPLTPIHAMARVTRSRPGTRLVFLGVGHPSPAAERMEMRERAVELARELGLLDRSVLFNFGWVPYEERASYLLEADLGISTHLADVEAAFSYRTRLLDHLWALLPTVTTRGDVFAELIERHELGRTIAAEDVDGCSAAILDLLEDERQRDSIRGRMAALRSQLTWARAVEPLLELLEHPPPRRDLSPARAGYRAALYAARKSLLTRT